MIKRLSFAVILLVIGSNLAAADDRLGSYGWAEGSQYGDLFIGPALKNGRYDVELTRFTSTGYCRFAAAGVALLGNPVEMDDQEGSCRLSIKFAGNKAEIASFGEGCARACGGSFAGTYQRDFTADRQPDIAIPSPSNAPPRMGKDTPSYLP